MFLAALCFLAGISSLLLFPKLPALIFLPLILACFSLFLLIKTYGKFLACLVLGFIWMWIYSYIVLSWQLPKDMEGKNIIVQGTVCSIPEYDSYSSNFIFCMDQLNHQFLKKTVRVNLSWYNNSPLLTVGEKWRFNVRLHRPHGLANPGGINREVLLFQQKIRAIGYVTGNDYQKLNSSTDINFLIDRGRTILADRVQMQLFKQTLGGMVSALSLGIRNSMTPEDWLILQATGTSHLFAISGLHISLVASFIYLIVNKIWRSSMQLMLFVPAPQVARLIAWLAAILYSMMAGFAIPTQRALVMLSVFLGASLLKKVLPPWYGFGLALFLVLFLDPLTVLSSSFWLSFMAAGIIIYGVGGRLNPQGLWWRWGHTQWIVTIGLLPLSLALFTQVSLIAPIANAVAIPWISFVVLPLSLVGTLFSIHPSFFSQLLLNLAEKSLEKLWWILQKLAAIQAVWHYNPNQTITITAIIAGTLWLLAPKGCPARWLGLVGLLPLVVFQWPHPLLGQAWVTILDVGQGLSVVVQTTNHLLIYDTGPKSNNFDTATAVILPFLSSINVHKVDTLVISHGDNDHSGGALTLLKHMPITHLLTGEPLKNFQGEDQHCQAGMQWQWDEIEFKMLYPFANTMPRKRNNYSCVLQIQVGKNVVLLPGDIEGEAESALLAAGKLVPLTVLVAAHHGSRTSSTAAFVKKVQPRYVVFAVGYHNRYHFPNKQVVQRFKKYGANLADTASEGAVHIIITKDTMGVPVSYRQTHLHYWQE